MESFRVPLVVLEIAVLGAILALIDDPPVRVVLGVLVALLLARGALSDSQPAEGAPAGELERRRDHLFRHWLNTLTKKAREFHTVCGGVKEGRVNAAVGQLKIQQIEQELQSLLSQMADVAKPQQLKMVQFRRTPGGAKGSSGDQYDTHMEGYGEEIPD